MCNTSASAKKYRNPGTRWLSNKKISSYTRICNEKRSKEKSARRYDLWNKRAFITELTQLSKKLEIEIEEEIRKLNVLGPCYFLMWQIYDFYIFHSRLQFYEIRTLDKRSTTARCLNNEFAWAFYKNITDGPFQFLDFSQFIVSL